MFSGKKICVVVPCYNESKQIGKVLTTLPSFITNVCVINDKSTDDTAEVVNMYAASDARIVLLNHEHNEGVGGAIATGYKWARDNGMDMAVVMAGDAQMEPEDLPKLIEPVSAGEVDYAKGNRLLHANSERIPAIRFWGNSVLSLLTKIASGYWHIADSQCGYTCINSTALRVVDWDKMYKRYGQPNDLLVTLNVHDLRVRDINVEPLYNVGEQSGFKSHRVVWPIAKLLVKKFFWRLKEKYVIRDFHPLVFFYSIAFFFSIVTVILFVRLIFLWFKAGDAPDMTAMAMMFSAGYWLQSTSFAMWMDMEANKHLR